jgi:hypothetical protein
MRKLRKNPFPSRRSVQRRFPPGSFVLSEDGIVGTVVGWSPVAGNNDPRWMTYIAKNVDYDANASSWEALLLTTDSVIVRRPWMSMISLMNLDEWEDWVTSPC